MKAKKLLALSMTAAMVLGMTACGGEEASNSSVAEESSVESTVESSEETPSSSASEEKGNVDLQVGEVSIDFEDGNFGFVGNDKSVAAAKADDSVLEVVSYNGSKALKVTPQGGTIYVGIQADALLGDDVSKVRTIEMTIGTENPDGNFASTSGKIYTFLGEDNTKNESAWSVYLETANPKRVTCTVPDGQSFTAGNYIVVSLETDTGKDKGATAANLYIDDIAFLDASGNVLKADTTAEYVAASTDKVDRSNLYSLKNAVNFEGFAISAGGWSQDGFDMPQEILDALVPGSVVEISYSSENGDMWIVMPDSENGWMRVGQGNADGSNSDSAIFDGSKCYITYEQIAAVCGDDVSKWGARMQCEATGAWEVYGVKVGKAAEFKALKNLVNFEGFAISAGAWSQDGFDMPQEILDALVPGSVVSIQYTSETGDMWIVMPDSENGWMRVAQGNADGSNSDSAVFNGSVCQITYEQIAAVCGDDVSKWGARMQCEASGAWEVYSVKVGSAN